MVSFCGYFPAEAPQYTCIVAIRLAYGLASGGGQAGPVFKKIAESIYANAVTTDLTNYEDTLAVHVPYVKNGDLDATKAILSTLNIPFHSPVITTNEIGEAISDETRVTLSVRDNDYQRMPDLTGMGLRDAVYEIERRGMRVKVKGIGSVKRQSVEAGSEVTPKRVVVIELGTN